MIPELLILLTHPPELYGRLAGVFGMDNPDSVILCCFFQDEDLRRVTLQTMKLEAGRKSEGGSDTTETLAARCSLALAEDDPLDALLSVIRWRTTVHGGAYHNFILKKREPPYSYGLIVSFADLDQRRLGEALSAAERTIQEQQEAVMDIFGWGVQE